MNFALLGSLFSSTGTVFNLLASIKKKQWFSVMLNVIGLISAAVSLYMLFFGHEKQQKS